MGGLSIANQIGNSLVEEGGFSWTDADAEAYYDTLKTVNGGDINASGLYSITLDELKEGINTAFVDAKSDGTYSKITHWFPVIGGTAATHAICAVTLASQLTFVGSPTHSALGVSTNGSTQHIDSNTSHSVFAASRYDAHWSYWTKNVTNNMVTFGSRNNAAVSLWNRVISSTTMGGALIGVSTNTSVTSPNEMFIGRIIGNGTVGDRRIYQNGSTLLSVGLATGGDVTTNSVFNAWSNAGSIINRSAGDFTHGTLGDGLSDSQASNLYTVANDLRILLGR